jgi:hypothetical protein
MVLSLISCLVMVIKRPYKGKLESILNLAVESAYFLVFIVFMSLHFTSISPDTEEKRTNLGYFMIALIIVVICRVLVDLVVSLMEYYQLIKKYCCKKVQNKVKPLNK